MIFLTFPPTHPFAGDGPVGSLSRPFASLAKDADRGVGGAGDAGEGEVVLETEAE